MQSFKKKVLSLIENGIEPLEEGFSNFRNPVLEIERLAINRMDTCVGCEFFKEEPISFLRVEDKSIPELSKMYCDDCGCTLSYKLRQSISKCNKWGE